MPEMEVDIGLIERSIEKVEGVQESAVIIIGAFTNSLLEIVEVSNAVGIYGLDGIIGVQ